MLAGLPLDIPPAGEAASLARRLVVVTVTDRNYAELTGVMLLSLAAHAGESVAEVHVLGAGLTAEDRRRIAACYPQTGRLHIHDVDAQVSAMLARMRTRTHIAPCSYARLLIPRLLPDVEKRILYVDCDVIINGPLDPLLDTPMDGYAVAAVRDVRTEAHAEWNRRLGLPEETPYLNGGVLLIEPSCWRSDGITEASCEVALHQPDRLQMMDQDALNIVLAGHWLPLEREWNYYESSFRSRQSGIEGFAAARIIHFVGRTKPNHADCRHPARDIYRAYRARSPWAGEKLHDPVMRNIRVYALETLRRVTGLLRRVMP